MDNIQRFSPIDGNNNSNNKPFRISKNGIGTGVFNARENNNHHIRIQIQNNGNAEEQNQ